jgi:hypothetical protein
MASFYLPESHRKLAQLIAEESGAKLLERPEVGTIEVHGERLVVTVKMLRKADELKGLPADLPHDATGTLRMLKRNANGRLTETPDSLIVEGTTVPGEPPKRAGCAALVLAFPLVVGVLIVLLVL